MGYLLLNYQTEALSGNTHGIDTSSGSADTYALMAVSYGVIWTGPNNYYSINWDVEKDNRFSPHLGPSSTNREWSPIFTHGGVVG